MTLAFRNQLSQTAKQMRTLLASPPPDWHAADDESPALSLLALEEEMAVNTEHSDALYNEAARFEEGQRLFLSAFGKLLAGAKDAEQKEYDDLLAEFRLDELQTACRQLISTLARRIRAYKRKESDLRAQIAQEQSRAAAHVTLEDDAGRDMSFLRDTVVGPIQQMLQQNQQLMQTMLQALNLQNRPEGPATPVPQPPTTAPAVSTVSAGPASSTHTAATFSVPQSDANATLHSGSLPVSSVPGGPLPVFITAPTPMMPIFTSRNMGAQSTFTPHSSHWTTPPGTGFGGQHQGRPQYFSSPFVPQMPSNAVLQAFSTQSRFHLPLPTLEIPHFSGERSKWRPFWHKFRLVIQHHPELSDLEKHTLLLNYLKGDAKKLVDGIPEAEGNFQIVIDILRDEYDNRPQLVRDLYSQLQKLESATSLSKLKELYFGFVRICRQLEIEGESPNHNPLLWKMVYDKMAKSYLSKLLAKKPVNSEWTALSIQAALREVIKREEELAEHKAEHRTERPSKDLDEREEEPDQHYTILSTMVDQKKRPEPQRSCSFCQRKDHWTDGCHKYPDYQTRVDRTRELHQCFKCLRTGHGSKKCKATLSNCFHCKRKHNSALCREKFEQKRSDNQEQKPKDTKTKHTKEKESIKTMVAGTKKEFQTSNMEAKETRADAPELNSATATPSSVFPGNKQSELTLLMAAEAYVFNSEDPSRRIKALITLDTHSHITVISDNFYKRLGLMVNKREQLNIAPFGDNKSIRFNTNKVRFGVELLNKEEVVIEGYTKQVVTVSAPLAAIKQEDLKNLDSKGYPVRFRAPDILIGIDNYHAFQVQVGDPLQSGFHLSTSALGPLISGKGIHKAQHSRFRRKEWHKPKVPKPAISSLEDSVAKKTGRKANTIQKSQAKIRTQHTINQAPVIVGHCSTHCRTQKNTQQIPKTGSGNKSSKRRRELKPERKPSTVANPDSAVKNEVPKKTPYLVQKKMPTPLHPKVEKESNPYKQPMVAKPHPTPETQAKHQMLLRPRRKQNRCSNCSNSPCRCAGSQPTVILNSSVEMRLPPRSVQCQTEPDPSELAVTDSSNEKLDRIRLRRNFVCRECRERSREKRQKSLIKA
ncbi:Zinc knuckle family protein [Ditylenchus destructor]|uniref:Zinc knuckle family protein n=1 Tax=Ditylenchus destructor TaxID=166010 RepID=A0AAD4MIJ8_9BILA|nr:Zinc knuckle family protein [Ditylenchus destructor]